MHKLSFLIKWTIILSLGLTLLNANRHANPLSIFSDRQPAKSEEKAIHKPINSTPQTTHPIVSRRSLASYGRMKNEYLGPVYNSESITKTIDPTLYTKHVLTNKPYLELKAIDGPLPQDYNAFFLKSKTLLNPTENYLKIIVDKSIQRIYVYRDLEHLYTFKSSTGRRGYITPNGTFKPYSLESMHYSRKYHNSPMPWSVFFNGGVAIHGTVSIRNLGHAASHGCVRTHPVSARRIYRLIRKYGKKNTTIIVKN